jgi:uncharacterized protein YceH (UPF0502 family)
MATCNGCGGVVGRDCWNPVECEQIANQMEQNKHYSLEQRVQSLEQELAELRRLLLPLERHSPLNQGGKSDG